MEKIVQEWLQWLHDFIKKSIDFFSSLHRPLWRVQLFYDSETLDIADYFPSNIVNWSVNASWIHIDVLIILNFRLANDAKGKGGERQFNGLIDVYVKTLKTDGIQGLYRGFAISCVGIFIYRGMYFGMYDSLKPILLGEDAGVLMSFLLGWAVTITAGLMSYPIDTIRRRMMMTSGSAVKYKVRIVLCCIYYFR